MCALPLLTLVNEVVLRSPWEMFLALPILGIWRVSQIGFSGKDPEMEFSV